MIWHTTDTEKVFEELGTSKSGLSSEVAEQRMEEFGKNELQGKKKKPAWLLFLLQFKDFMILILIAAAVISGLLGEITDTIIILVIVILNAIVGFVQEYRAEKALEALQKMATPQSNVIRDGKPLAISSLQLVPGDIVLLEAGTLVPADARLIEAHALRIEESSLTGESVAVDKNIKTLEKENLPMGDRENMAYKGTQVSAGRGTAVVVATGMHTELGKIAGMLQGEEKLTPLQTRMADFGKKLSYIILGICLVLFGVGLLRGEDAMDMVLVSISLAVAAIPEALPALITIALARGAKRLVKKNALIRKLPAVETLGSVTFICSDKTGTLTQNKMTVVKVKPSENTIAIFKEIPPLVCLMALNHDVKKTKDNEWIGDPTEIALIDYAEEKYGSEQIDALQKQLKREAELPFDSDRKRMTTVHRFKEKLIAIVKGSAEAITEKLKDDSQSKKILDDTNEMAENGIRVLAYGYRLLDSIPDEFSYEEIEQNLEFAGLVGMIDPPREEVKAAIEECRTAGIKTVMITGDHKETAAAIAGQIGILTKDGLVIAGPELSELSDAELDDKVEKIKVYARVSPEQKLKIVKSLQRRNHFVAMTGDGVNDAPSLKTSNIGIAMGITGTDVSKEAAHMILLDDNFTTIVKAVKEGRRIYDNIRKFVKYIMTCNSAEIWTIFMAPILGLPIPLLPIHILWINLVTDGLPGLALSTEKAEKNVMQRPPRKTDESLFSEGIGYHIVWVGILMAGITLGTQAWAIHANDTHWQTMVFTVLSLSQLGHVLAIRSEDFIYNRGLFSNKPMIFALSFTFLLQLAVIYLPIGNRLFKTQPLTFYEILICVGVSAIVFHAVELEKLVRKRRRKKGETEK